MPRVHQVTAKLAIYIYAAPAERPPPHFHVVGPETDVQVEIPTLRIMEGQYRPKDIVEALAWAADNVALLQRKWSEFNERE